MESWSRNAILTNGFWKEMLLDTDPENLRPGKWSDRDRERIKNYETVNTIVTRLLVANVHCCVWPGNANF